MRLRTTAAALLVAVGLLCAAVTLLPAGVAQAEPAGRDCADFDTQRQAQTALDAGPADPERLDADGDGEACEVHFGTAARAGAGGGKAGETSKTDTETDAGDQPRHQVTALPRGGVDTGDGEPRDAPLDPTPPTVALVVALAAVAGGVRRAADRG